MMRHGIILAYLFMMELLVADSCHLINTQDANCSSLHLTVVPQDLPSAIGSLDLSFNQIQVLLNRSFVHFPYLETLNLQNNALQSLEVDAFANLSNLRVLVMTQNKLAYSVYHPDIFLPTVALEKLFISQNIGVYTEETSYPGKALSRLSNLRELDMDVLPESSFGEEFSRLTNLEILSLSTSPGSKMFLNKTFAAFKESKIYRLNLNGCSRLTYIEAGAFQPLVSLRELLISSAGLLSLRVFFKSLEGLRGRNISLIDAGKLHRARKLTMSDINDIIISSDSIKYLSQICLHYLHLGHNDIMYIDDKELFKQPFADCLENLDVSGNNLHGPVSFLLKFSRFTRLKYLDMSQQRELPTFQKDEILARVSSVRTVVHIRPAGLFQLTFSLPPKLEHFNARSAGRTGKILPIHFNNGQNVRVVDISYTRLSNFIYPVTGLENIEDLDLSGNDFSIVAPEFFDTFPNIKRLRLEGTFLNQRFLLEWGCRLFQPLHNLDKLVLSNNELVQLPENVFNNLVHFSLAGNSFTTVPLKISIMKNLRTLDLSYNSITYLTKTTRAELDIYAHEHNLSLLLYGNPLLCDCTELDFVAWLAETPVYLDHRGNYSCSSSFYGYTWTGSVLEKYDQIWIRCQTSFWLSFSGVRLVAILVTIVLVFLVSKFRTNLQRIILRIIGLGDTARTRNDYRYDAYIAYSDQDTGFVYGILRNTLERTAKLRLFLRERDVLPGRPIADGVVDGIQASWRIVFILTPNFLQDEWGDFMVATAVTRLVPGRLLLLMVEPVNKANIPEVLLNAVEENDIFDLTGVNNSNEIWARIIDYI